MARKARPLFDALDGPRLFLAGARFAHLALLSLGAIRSLDRVSEDSGAEYVSAIGPTKSRTQAGVASSVPSLPREAPSWCE